MKRVLIAYDGSAGAEAAIRDLVKAGLPEELIACVISVADVWLPPNWAEEPLFPAGLPKGIQQARAGAIKALEDQKRVATQGGDRVRELFPKWDVTVFTCADSPGWGIISKSISWKADLVVVGSQGRNILERIFLGSVAQKVAAEAQCSVRIARLHGRKTGEPLKLLLAVDGSSDSENAARELAARQWPEGTQLRVIASVDPKLASMAGWPEEASRGGGASHGEVTEWVNRMTEHAAEILRGNKSLMIETDVFDGEAKDVILRESAGMDTIFLGARGLHHGTRLYLGTTASTVAARAHCTVEIIRHKIEPAEKEKTNG